jgi:hypothetical protein
MCGAISAFPNTPSMRGAQSKHRDNFTHIQIRNHDGTYTELNKTSFWIHIIPFGLRTQCKLWLFHITNRTTLKRLIISKFCNTVSNRTVCSPVPYWMYAETMRSTYSLSWLLNLIAISNETQQSQAQSIQTLLEVITSQAIPEASRNIEQLRNPPFDARLCDCLRI